MPVDYFSGVNQGTQNLMNAMNSYQTENYRQNELARQGQRDVLANTLAQQKIDEGSLALEAAQRRKQGLADIMKVYQDNVKTPATTTGGYSISPADNLTSALTQTSVQPGSGLTPTTQPQVTTPAVNYTPTEQNQRALAVAMKTDPSLVGEVGQMADITNKINPNHAQILFDGVAAASRIMKETGRPELANVALQQYAQAHGVSPEEVGNVQFSNDGGINVMEKTMPDGSKIRIVPPQMGAPGRVFQEVPKSNTQTDIIRGALRTELKREPTDQEILDKQAAIKADKPDILTPTMKDFETLYPSMAGQKGMEDYAAKYKKYQSDLQQNKINVTVAGSQARGASYANERFYSMYDTKDARMVKVKGNALNEDSNGRYLDPQDPNIKADSGSLAKVTKGMDSVNAFEKGASTALTYAQSVAQDFGLGKYPQANKVSQLFQYHLGDPKVKGLQNAITTAATEYMKVINAGTDLTASELTVMGQQRAKEIIQAADNFDSLKNSIGIMKREMQISGDKFKAQRREIQGRMKEYGGKVPQAEVAAPAAATHKYVPGQGIVEIK